MNATSKSPTGFTIVVAEFEKDLEVIGGIDAIVLRRSLLRTIGASALALNGGSPAGLIGGDLRTRTDSVPGTPRSGRSTAQLRHPPHHSPTNSPSAIRAMPAP